MAKLIDLTGKTYGDWTIIRREGLKGSYVGWLSKCKCGIEKIIPSRDILDERGSKDCGCSKNWVGTTKRTFKILEKLNDRANTYSSFRCLCRCGAETTVHGNSLSNGNVISCGCTRTKDIEILGSGALFNSYKKSARNRNIEFRLGKEYFNELLKMNCFYCKSIPKNVYKFKDTYSRKNRGFIFNGIDRKDNSKGYTIENVVTCCTTCNTMKWDLSIDEWKKHMRVVLDNIRD